MSRRTILVVGADEVARTVLVEVLRGDPDLAHAGKSAMTLDSKAPSLSLAEYMYAETRFKLLTQTRPSEAERRHRVASGRARP